MRAYIDTVTQRIFLYNIYIREKNLQGSIRKSSMFRKNPIYTDSVIDSYIVRGLWDIKREKKGN